MLVATPFGVLSAVSHGRFDSGPHAQPFELVQLAAHLLAEHSSTHSRLPLVQARLKTSKSAVDWRGFVRPDRPHGQAVTGWSGT